MLTQAPNGEFSFGCLLMYSSDKKICKLRYTITIIVGAHKRISRAKDTNMTTNNGFAITIFLPNGDPDGVKEVTKGNWIGHGLVIPRTLFNDAKKRPELKQTGVYLLVESTAPRIYIGEGDPVGPRLEQHAQTKDFWTHAVIFTSSAQNLHKTHIQYLESKLVQLAQQTKLAYLDNGNIPQLPTTSAIIRSEAENFLQDMLMCLPLLGYSYFRTVHSITENTPIQQSQSVLLHLKSEGKNIHATGYEVSGGFVVQKGSRAVLDHHTVNSLSTGIRKLRADLVARQVLVHHDSHYLFAIDYQFSAPSTASDTILGSSTNGRTMWKTSTGITLKERQERGSSGKGS